MRMSARLFYLFDLGSGDGGATCWGPIFPGSRVLHTSLGREGCCGDVVCVLRFVRAVVAAPTRMLRSVVVFGRAVFFWSRSERAFEFGFFSRGMDGLGSVSVNSATICLGCSSRSGGILRHLFLAGCIYFQIITCTTLP